MEKKIETVNVTPSWVEILPVLLMLRDNASPEGRGYADQELRRMAALADAFVATLHRQIDETLTDEER